MVIEINVEGEAMGIYEMNPEEVEAQGQKLKSHATKILEILNDVKQGMDSISPVFNNRIGDPIRRDFNTNSDKFKDFKERIDDYSDYLLDYSSSIRIDDQLWTDAQSIFKTIK